MALGIATKCMVKAVVVRASNTLRRALVIHFEFDWAGGAGA